MPFHIDFPTRHTDAFAATGYVHAGVLLGLTEMAYAAFEKQAGISKPAHVYAVQRATEATYHSPLSWDEGARISISTLAVTELHFDQSFDIESAKNGRRIATFVHHWVWLDTQTGKRVKLSPEDQQRLLAG